MIDQIFVCIGCVIYRNPPKSCEKVARLNSDEAIDTDVADVGGISIDLISDIAVLFDVLAAGTTIKLFTDLHPNEGPFGPRCVKVVGYRKGKNMSGQPVQRVLAKLHTELHSRRAQAGS